MRVIQPSIRIHYQMIIQDKIRKPRPTATCDVHVVLRNDNDILLMLRQNTGYADGFYGLVSGHVEQNEPAHMAAVREAQEESGITILTDELQLFHVIHLRSDNVRVAFFFVCDKWNGNIRNCEPEKCRELQWFPLDHLPDNVIPYVTSALQSLRSQNYYSAIGWEAI